MTFLSTSRAALLAPLLLGCASLSDDEAEWAVMEEVRAMREAGSVDETIGHTGFEIVLRFYGDVTLEDGRTLPWTAARRAPYVRAAHRWLQVIRGVEGKEHHRLTLHLFALPFPFGNGAAMPDLATLDRDDGRLIPTEGEVIIDSFLLAPDAQAEAWVRAEEVHNALHEMGHAFGIGALWNVPEVDESFDPAELEDPARLDDAVLAREWVVDEPALGGPVYRRPHAVAAFRRVMRTDLPFVPIGRDEGHLFALYDEEVPRTTADGAPIPTADLELMSHKKVLSEISVGFLDDLGYVVDYGAADPYVEGRLEQLDVATADLHPFLRAHFDVGLDVFGVRVLATRDVPAAKVEHVGAVLAEYLDNDEDGLADDPRVVRALRRAGAAMIMTATEEELERLFQRAEEELAEDDGADLAIQPQWATETHPDPPEGTFDATLEEVLHLVTQYGWAAAYPNAFGERPGSRIADAMDVARGGPFRRVPDRYPADAWYTYDDETCDYPCQITEYLYWGLTSLLGAQTAPWRAAEIAHEWRLTDADALRAGDPLLFALLTDPRFALPTRLPDGRYEPPGPPDRSTD